MFGANRFGPRAEVTGMNPRPSFLKPVFVIGATIVLTVAACGGDDDGDADADPTTAAETEASSDTTDAAVAAPPVPDDTAGDTNTITIASFAFDGVTEVPVGTTVTVTNDDTTTHTWSAEDGTFDSGALAPGDSFEFTFGEAGEFAFFCNFHPSMQGTITVTA
jgi:plastocyanin